MDEIREKYYGGDNAAREAFEELCAMVDNINVSTYIGGNINRGLNNLWQNFSIMKNTKTIFV